jgi:NAD+ kinase
LNKPSAIRRIGLIANPDKPQSAGVLRQAAALIARAGRAALTERPTAELAGLKLPLCADIAALAREADLLLVFGGDGTMLRVTRDLGGSTTPILGINVGGLGFLTAVSSDELAAALRKIWAGQFTLEGRPLLEARGLARGGRIAQVAFNDFVITRGTASRLIQLEVTVDGETLTQYRCDGLIVSSPTGSTAYSLAAGGAVVAPDAEVFCVTPICPHTLSNRSVIVNLSSTVGVKVLTEKIETFLSADGQVQVALTTGDEVKIRRSRRSVRLVRLAGSSFFKTLRHKLHWSGSNV